MSEVSKWMESIENTIEQDQYKEYLKTFRINQEEGESLFEWADFFSVKDIPNWNTAMLDLKNINSYINIQLQQRNKEWKLIPAWKEYPILVFKNNVYDLDIKTWNIQVSNKFKIENWKINLINKKEANKTDNRKSEIKDFSDYEKALLLDKELEPNLGEDSSYSIEDYEKDDLENIYEIESKWWIIESELIEWNWEEEIDFDEDEEILFEIPQTRPKNLSLYKSMEYDVQNELNNLILDTNLKTNIFEQFQNIYDWDFETHTEEKAKEFYNFLTKKQWLDVLQASLILWETIKEYFKNK